MIIKVTTLDGRQVVINANLIERIENVPETVIVLTNNKRILVQDSVEEIICRVMEYQGRVANWATLRSSQGED